MKKNIKSLLICNSNMFIPTVLTELLEHPKENYLVISDTKSITKFFEFLAIPNMDYIEYGWTKGRLGFIEKKRELYRNVQQYEIEEVVFFHAEWGEMANWLIKRLSKSIHIKYCKIYDSIPVPHSKSWKKVLKIKIQQKIWWGVDVEVLEHSYAFPSLPDSFFKRVKAETIQIPVNNNIVTNFMSEKLGKLSLKADNVLLTGTIVKDGLSDSIFYSDLINKVIDAIGDNNLISKCHPRYKELYGKEVDLPQIPSFIPGNVLVDNYKCFIGFESTLLVEAAIAGKKSISLIYLLEISDEKKSLFVKFFNSRLQGKGVILYPKKLEELAAIIAKDKTC